MHALPVFMSVSTILRETSLQRAAYNCCWQEITSLFMRTKTYIHEKDTGSTITTIKKGNSWRSKDQTRPGFILIYAYHSFHSDRNNSPTV